MIPKVTALVTFWQSTAKMNFALSVMSKLRRTPLVRRNVSGARSPNAPVRGALPIIKGFELQNGPVLLAQATPPAPYPGVVLEMYPFTYDTVPRVSALTPLPHFPF